MSQLLQIKMQENFLDKLKRIAQSQNLNVSAFVKYTLTKEIRKLEEDELSENWFSKTEEEKILKSIHLTKIENKEWETKTQSVDNFLESI